MLFSHGPRHIQANDTLEQLNCRAIAAILSDAIQGISAPELEAPPDHGGPQSCTIKTRYSTVQYLQQCIRVLRRTVSPLPQHEAVVQVLRAG